MPSIRWLSPQSKSLPSLLRGKKEAVLTRMGRSRFCVSSPLLTLRPLINPLSSIIRKIALLYNRAAGSVRVYGEVCVWKETSLYIGVPLTRSGYTSVFSIPSAPSFSSPREFIGVKRSIHVFF